MTESIAESEELANLLNDRMKHKKGGNNQRLAIMLGMLTKDKDNPIKANIPSEDRSMFSLEKYKFFLDAPFEISNKCCNVMKKDPLHRYSKETGRQPITAQMADESRLRTQKWLQHGCNAFDSKEPISNPMSFWVENDVLEYIFLYLKPKAEEAWNNAQYSHGRKRKKARKYLKKIAYSHTGICSVYGDVVKDYSKTDIIPGQTTLPGYEDDIPLKTTGCSRTGCMLCGFGCHLEKSPNRFEMMKETHPKMYGLLDVIKNNGYTMRQAIEWINENGNINIKL